MVKDLKKYQKMELQITNNQNGILKEKLVVNDERFNGIVNNDFIYVDKIEDLKHEIVSVLLEEKIMKFDATNGAKAYSYFGTIVKRWLINYNNKNYKKLKQIGSFSDVEECYEPDLEVDGQFKMSLSAFLDMWITEMYERVDEFFPKEQEAKIADAVLTIFKTRHDLEIFKKKALYIYIREMTDCETPHLTRVVSKLKSEFYNKYFEYSENGLVVNILD